MTLQIYPIPALQDNYIWVIHNGTHAVVVDPGQSLPVEQYLAEHKLQLHGILITHHHYDHIDGVEALLEQWNCEIFAPADSRISFKHQVINEQSKVFIEPLDLTLKILEIPGHTLSHICYYNDQWLFCGDTLFSMGCGRMFEGTPEQFVNSLNKLKKLDPNTSVCCGHEYTLSNISFALAIEPENVALLALQNDVKQLRQAGKSSLPSTLQTEIKLNPFLKTNLPSFQKLTAKMCQQDCNDETVCFALLRKLKDNF